METSKKLQPRDLRIGNYVKYKGDVYCVSAIRNYRNGRNDCLSLTTPKWFDSNTVDVECAIDEVEPIPLSKELMEKCNFDYSDLCDSYRCLYNPPIDALIDGDGYEDAAYITVNDSMIFPSLHVRYLHELQNLYWAVTGRELEVKL